MSLAELRLTQLYVIMRDDRVPDRDRLEASKEILSRRFGPPKAVTEAVGSIPTLRRGAGQTDLQFRLRCRGCNRRSGFRITIFDDRSRGDSSKPRLERVVVGGLRAKEVGDFGHLGVTSRVVVSYLYKRR